MASTNRKCRGGNDRDDGGRDDGGASSRAVRTFANATGPLC